MMRRNNVLAGVLTAAMVLGSLTLPENISINGFDFGALFAQAEGEVTFSGDGTEENPYQVATAAQLSAVRENLSAYYIQTADIDLLDEEWLPIGYVVDGDSEAFTGSYDGNGYQITNMSITSLYDFDEGIGLFSESTGVLQNIQIELLIDVDFAGYIDEDEINSSYIGAVVAKNNDGTVTNCTISGEITIANAFNLIIGGVVGTGECSYCTNYASVNVESKEDDGIYGWTMCGGIVGYPGSKNGEISYCTNYGNVEASGIDYLHCGGISGQYGWITCCANYGDISGTLLESYTWNFSYGNCNVGGIVGDTSSLKTQYCVNYGNISSSRTCDDASCYAGGISGKGNCYLMHCYNVGQSISSDGAVGRIVGSYGNSSTSDNYSLDTTTINGEIPAETGTSTINGGDMSEEEILEKAAYVLEHGSSIMTYGDYEYSYLEDETVEIYKYLGTDEDVEVPTEIDGRDVTSIGNAAFMGCSDITEVVLPDTLTNIGDYAFSGCTSLSGITYTDSPLWFLNNYYRYYSAFMFPESLVSIGDYAFYECGLSSISLNKGIESIGEEAFSSSNVVDEEILIYYVGTKAEWDSYGVECDVIYYLTDFTLSQDNNSYIHGNTKSNYGFYGIQNYMMDREYFVKLTQYLTVGEKFEIIEKMCTLEWGGVCYGIAATMALTSEGVIDVDDLSSADVSSYYEMYRPCEDAKLLNNLTYYNLSQYLSAYSEAKIATSMTHANDKNGWLSGLTGYESEQTFWFKLITTYLSTGKVLILNYDEDSGVGHSVLVTGCAYDAVNDEYRIQIYDENTVNDSNNDEEHISEIYVSGDLKSLNLNYYNMSFIEIDKLSSLAKGTEAAGNTNDIILKVILYTDSEVEITNSEGAILSYDGSDFSGDMSVTSLSRAVCETADEEQGIYYILELEDSSDTFDIVSLSENIDIDIYDADNFISLSGSGIDSASISLEDGIDISGIDYDFTVFISTNGETDDNIGLVSVSAAASSDVSITRDGEYIIVTSDEELQDIVVANYDNVKKNEVSMDKTATRLTLTGTGENVVVNNVILGDINQDGAIGYLDAMMVLRHDAMLIELDENQLLAGDVNGDGEVNSLDAILILRYDAGLVTGFSSM